MTPIISIDSQGQLKSGKLSPALRLLQQFVKAKKSERSGVTFKAIAQFSNIEEVGVLFYVFVLEIGPDFM